MRRPGIVINGKFLTAGPTAVHAVALELSRALISSHDTADMMIAMPRSKVYRADAIELPIRKIGPLNGILWEQGTLPLALKNDFLLNLCNMTPLLVRNAMTMVHDAQVFTTPRSYGQRRSAWARQHIRLAGRLQRGLLTVSEFAKSELVALGIAPPERIHVIHNGVDHVLRVPPDDEILASHNLNPRRFALALANTQPHKNIGVLLRAFVQPELAELTLVLAGSATAADFAARGYPVPPNVIFVGYVSDGEMRSLQRWFGLSEQVPGVF